MDLKVVIKKAIPGIVWQNHVVNFLLRIVDPFDHLVRLCKRIGHFPRYSIRVRSNGFSRQFGGTSFQKFGRTLFDHLRTNANVTSDSRILEIGCGCGRTAFAIAESLKNFRYTGMDIEKRSLAYVRSSQYLQNRGAKFEYLDIQNDEYNPKGTIPASTYRFPNDDGSIDVIFLVSVFTHMLTDDVRNYIAEISRMLAVDGTCMLTTFLMDHGRLGPNVSFPYRDQEHFYRNTEMPEIAVGYMLSFYVQEFAKHGLTLKRDALWGSWRDNPTVQSSSGFGQDILFFTRQSNLRPDYQSIPSDKSSRYRSVTDSQV